MITEKHSPLTTSPKYIYDPAAGRHKHRWNKNKPGFANYRGQKVGKCPHDITQREAQALLNEAIPNPPDPYLTDPFPKRLYALRCGIIYEAIGDGRSNRYHAYPAKNISMLDEETLSVLRTRAERSGHQKEFNKWTKEHD